MAGERPPSPDIPHAPWRGEPTDRPQSARSAEPSAPKPPLTARPGTARARQTKAAAEDPWGPARAKRKPALDTGVFDKRGYSKQSLAVKKSAPNYGFGSGTRDQVNKLFISQEHTLTIQYGKESPGPAQYMLPPSVGGKQPDGRKGDPPVWSMGVADRFLYGYISKQERARNAVAPGPVTYDLPPTVGGKQPDTRLGSDPPVWGFGSGTRDQVNKLFISQEHTLTIQYGKESPGPAKYMLPPSVGGKQPDGRKGDPPVWSFAKSPRKTMDDEEVSRRSPGMIYNIPAAVGPQPDGRIPNAPRYGMGASTRETRSKVYMTKELMEGGPPHFPTPGPAGTITLTPAIGKQVDGKKATSPRCSFTRRSRWADHEREIARNTVPGPGAYG